MTLTRLVLNPRSLEAARDVAAPYELHRTLGRAFGVVDGVGYRQARHVLFRIEPEAPGGRGRVVLVQADGPLDAAALPAGYALEVDRREVTWTPTAGQRLRFRLLANATSKASTGVDGGARTSRNGRRVALPLSGVEVGETPALDWLARQGERWGFRVVTTAMERVDPPARRWTAAEKGTLPHVGVRFDGVLEVTDAAAFVTGLRQGVGPAKAFGFGLLSVAPA